MVIVGDEDLDDGKGLTQSPHIRTLKKRGPHGFVDLYLFSHPVRGGLRGEERSRAELWSVTKRTFCDVLSACQ